MLASDSSPCMDLILLLEINSFFKFIVVSKHSILDTMFSSKNSSSN